MAGIVVVGSVNMDVVTQVKAHPQPGETVRGSNTAYHAGGKGANQAVAAARAGASVRLFGAVGDDEHAGTLMACLQADHIDMSFVGTFNGSSGTAFITVSEAGENTIVVEPGANGRLTRLGLDNGIQHGLFDGYGTLLVQNEIPADVTIHAMKRAKTEGLHVIFNPAPMDGVTLAWLSYVDTVVVNETEAQALTGVSADTPEGIDEVLRCLLNGGAQSAIVTLGERGCVYGTVDPTNGAGSIKQIHQPAFQVQAVDTTAAGDTFVGAFAAAYEARQRVDEALAFAAAAAAISVTRDGAQPSIPRRDEVASKLASVGQK